MRKLLVSVLVLAFFISVQNMAGSNEETVPVIISYENKTVDKPVLFGLKSVKIHVKDSLSSEIMFAGGTVKYRYENINAISAKVPKSKLKKLQSNPNVKNVEIGRTFHAFLSSSVPQINADDVWSKQISDINVTGSDVTVCVIDTGIQYTHPDLGGCMGVNCRVLDGYDFVNNDEDPMDDHGHGTHVAGIAAANGTVKGVAPSAKLIAMKVLDSSGSGSEEDMNAGIDWCISNATKYNISVITMSLGTETLYADYCDSDYSSTADLINTAIANNITVTVAAGNDGNITHIASPACIQNSTAVGAVTDSDILIYNRNNITDLLAPGVTITSTYPTNTTASLSGTSMATPHVAGAVALLVQTKHEMDGGILTPTEIESHLNRTGVRINDSGGSNLIFSRIDVHSAFAFMTRPFLTIDSPLNKSYNKNWVWGNATINENTSWCGYSLNGTNNVTMNNDSITHFYANLSNLTEEQYNITFYCNDTYGNMGSSEVLYFTIDITAPVMNITSPLNATYTTQIIGLNYTVNEETDWVGYSLNGTANVTLNGNATITVSDGQNNITLYANDTAGNMNNSLTVYFYVDTTAPCVTITSPENKTYGATLLNLNYTTSEQPNWTGYSLNGSANVTVNGTLNFNTTFSASEGLNNIAIYANDSYGNTNVTIIYFTVDATPPAITIHKPENTTIYGDNTPEFNVSFGEVVNWSAYEIDSNGTNVTIGAVSDYIVNLSELSYGAHNITVYANNSAGIMNSTTRYFTLAGDNNPPNYTGLTESSEPAEAGVLTHIAINVSDGQTSVDAVLIDMGDVNHTMNNTNDYLYNYSWIPDSVGNITYRIIMNDTAGNYNETLFYNITVNDTRGPGILSYTPNATIASSSTVLNITTNENATCRYSTTSGVNYTNMTYNLTGSDGIFHHITASGMSSGTYHYYIRCADNYSNINESDFDAVISVAIPSEETITTTSGGGGGSFSTASTAKIKAIYVFDEATVGDVLEMSVNKEGMSFTEINVEAGTAVRNVKVVIEALQDKPLIIIKEPISQVYQYLQIDTENLENKIAVANISFKVNKSWIIRNNINKSTVALNRYVNDAWENLPTKYLKEDSKYAYYKADTPGFSVFAISGRKNTEEPKKPVAEEKGEIVTELPESTGNKTEEIFEEQETTVGLSREIIFIFVLTVILAMGFVVYKKRLKSKKQKPIEIKKELPKLRAKLSPEDEIIQRLNKIKKKFETS